MLSSSTVSKLDSLVGLAGAKKVIQRLSENDRGIHALLIYGAKGSGKSVLASLLTEMWLCNSPTSEGADGTCRSCVAYGRIVEGTDYHAPDDIPVKHVFLILTPAQTPREQLRALARIAGLVSSDILLAELDAATSPQKVLELVHAADVSTTLND